MRAQVRVNGRERQQLLEEMNRRALSDIEPSEKCYALSSIISLILRLDDETERLIMTRYEPHERAAIRNQYYNEPEAAQEAPQAHNERDGCMHVHCW